MSLSLVRAALKTRLETITGLTVSKETPDTVGKLPIAIVTLTTADYEVAVGNLTVAWSFRILLLVGERDSQTAHATLDGYLAKSGTTSIKAAIEGGSVGDFPHVRRAENVGFISYRGTSFVGAEFVVDVVDSS